MDSPPAGCLWPLTRLREETPAIRPRAARQDQAGSGSAQRRCPDAQKEPQRTRHPGAWGVGAGGGTLSWQRGLALGLPCAANSPRPTDGLGARRWSVWGARCRWAQWLAISASKGRTPPHVEVGASWSCRVAKQGRKPRSAGRRSPPCHRWDRASGEAERPGGRARLSKRPRLRYRPELQPLPHPRPLRTTGPSSRLQVTGADGPATALCTRPTDPARPSATWRSLEGLRTQTSSRPCSQLGDLPGGWLRGSPDAGRPLPSLGTKGLGETKS